MSDTEMERRKAICEVAGIAEIDDLSDGFHTFRQLYYQRMMLFAAIVRQNKDKAWKSLRHEDGELCFGGGWFIVGIDTPGGSFTYHYEDNYYSLFDCEELKCSKHWDGHTEKDVTRLLSLPSAQPVGYVHIDDVYRLISGHSNYHGDNILSALTCLAEGKEVLKPIAVLDAHPEQRWIPCEKELPEKYGEYRITWTTSASKKRFIGDAEYELSWEWDDDNYRYKGKWLLEDYVKAFPDVKVIAWKPLEEPYRGEKE